MKGKSYFSMVALLVLALFAFGGCGGGGGGSGGGGNDDPDFIKPVVYTPGEDVVVVTQTIGTAGGIIETGNTGTLVDGVIVRFPAGALSSDTKVELGYNRGSMTPNNGTWSGAAITLKPEGVEDFDVPIEITVPSEAAYGIIAPYYVEENGKIRPCQLVGIDDVAKTATFSTAHASRYLTIVPTFDFGNSKAYVAYYNFTPSSDGFGIKNFAVPGNPDAEGGVCHGMSAFSTWYFLHEKGTGKALNPRFDDDAEKYIATISQTALYAGHPEPIPSMEGIDQFRLRRIIENIMTNSGPILIALKGNGKHMVVAHGFHVDDKDNVKLMVYDPNFVGDTRFIKYDDSTGKFDTYDGYSFVAFGGDGSFSNYVRNTFKTLVQERGN